MDKILLTGGSGFLGSSLARRLLKEGHSLVILDDCSRGKLNRIEDILDRVVFIEGDIRHEQTVIEAARGCNAIFHLAFVNGTRFFYEKPELVLDVGVKGALNTIQASIENNVETYVLASSSEVYHQPLQIPTPETERLLIPDVLNPRFSYSGGKLISELLTINMMRKLPIRDMIFRPHNVFGPDMGFEHVIPEIMEKLKVATLGWDKKDVKISIQGSGLETRAFCFVEDAVDQIMTIYRKGKKGNIYHVGFDEEITIKKLIDYIAQILDLNVIVNPSELKSGSTTRRSPDISKIQKIGYSKVNNFYKGLKEAVFWYKRTSL